MGREKRCTKCKDMRPIEEFCKHKGRKDGLSSWCRACRYVPALAYKARYPERVEANKRRSYERHKIEKRAKRKKWRKDNPEKRKAQNAVYQAIKSGKLIRPDRCEECGGNGRITSHHDDYTKLLDVRWLCSSCHYFADQERRVADHA